MCVSAGVGMDVGVSRGRVYTCMCNLKMVHATFKVSTHVGNAQNDFNFAWNIHINLYVCIVCVCACEDTYTCVRLYLWM